MAASGKQRRGRIAPRAVKADRRAFWVLLALAVVVFLLLPWTSPVYRMFTIPSASMSPTIPSKTLVIVSRLSYGLSANSYDWFALPISGRWPALAPTRGDVIIFRSGRDRTFLMFRVVGLPGEDVQMIGGRAHINGMPVGLSDEQQVQHKTHYGKTITVPVRRETLPGGRSYRIMEQSGDKGYLDNTARFKVPPGHLFVLGDNRDNSLDSRVPASAGGPGMVAMADVLGRVVLRLASPL